METTLKQYARPARRFEQAHQLWPILSSWAVFGMKGRLEKAGLITYGEAARFLGYTTQAGHTLGEALGLISTICRLNNVPRLNTIVVDYETGEPGEGIPHDFDMSYKSMQHKVLKFNWFEYRQPTMRNFRDL